LSCRRSEVVRLLDRIEQHNGPVATDRTLAILSRIFTWHAVRDERFRSPLVRGMYRTNGRARARSRILDDGELQRLWAATSNGHGAFNALVRFLLLTGARRSEAAGMTWGEVVGADWTLPSNRCKTKLDLFRPLSKEAQRILEEQPRFAGCPFVFTLNGRNALRDFHRQKVKLDAKSRVTKWTLHDLRRTARSLMSRAGVPVDHAERCLGHVMPGIRGVYDKHSYRPEMERAYEALAALIERIVSPVENVVSMRG
jgi:integrase